MRINNRDIVLQGSGTINEGSGTPLSVPLTSGGSFNPKIFVQYTLERVDDNVYPFSSVNRPVKYILCVYSHVKNYKPGTDEYSYFDSMDKVFYYMIHNDTWNNYGAYKLIGNTTRIFTPDKTDLYVNTTDENAVYISDLGGKSYNFNRLSALLNSNNGLHPSDAPLNYLNFFPTEITKIKAALGDDKNGLIIDTACIKSPKEDYTNTFYSDGFLTKSNCIVSLSLSYPKEYNADIIVCNNTLLVEVKAPDTDILGRINVGSDDLKYYITGTLLAVLEKYVEITGNTEVVLPVEINLNGDIDVSAKMIKEIAGTLDPSIKITEDITGNTDVKLGLEMDIIGLLSMIRSIEKDINGSFIVKLNNKIILDINGDISTEGKISTDINGTVINPITITSDIISSEPLVVEITISDSLNDFSRKNSYTRTSGAYPEQGINEIKNIINNTPDGTYLDATSCFRDCSSTTSINTQDIDTSKFIYMQNMFSGMFDLESLDLSNWDTSKATSMAHMFENCQAMNYVTLSNWDTSRVTNMDHMFYSCLKIKELDLSNWDVSKVTNMGYMFYQCHSLESLNISNWDVSNVTNMSYMFRTTFTNCNLLDLSNWDVSNVRNMDHMFEWTWGTINTLILDNWIINANMESMFSIAKINNLSMINVDTSKVTNMKSLFSSSKINNINIELDLSSCTDVNNMFSSTTITSGSIIFNNVPKTLGATREAFISNIKGNSIASLITVNFIDE